MCIHQISFIVHCYHKFAINNRCEKISCDTIYLFLVLGGRFWVFLCNFKKWLADNYQSFFTDYHTYDFLTKKHSVNAKKVNIHFLDETEQKQNANSNHYNFSHFSFIKGTIFHGVFFLRDNSEVIMWKIYITKQH